MKKGLVIYHANCLDGFASALAVWKKYGDSWDYMPMQYGDAPTIYGDNRYENVMMVDFSWPRNRMEELAKSTNLLVIDHHKTAMEDCEGLDFCKFDLSKSGCEATWEYLFPREGVPSLFRYIGDRDLWKFELDDTKEFCAGLELYPRKFEEWVEFLTWEKVKEAISKGKTILQLQEKQVKDFVAQWNENIRYANIPLDYTVPIANCCDLISEKIGALSEGYQFAIGYFDTNEKRVFSLRSRLDTIDCGVIAKQYGGGGHPGAAGFSIPLQNVDPEMGPDFFMNFNRFNELV